LVLLFVADIEEGIWAIYAGAALAVPAALWLLALGVRALRSRHGAFGTNAALQILLAGLLLAGANLFAFSHYARWDLTWDGLFTIDERVRGQLSHLRDETIIVLHLRHVTFGQLKEHKLDNYDAAAERKVLEKVKDLVEQFQDLGPKFKVAVLDVQEEGYQEKLAALTKGSPALREAIDRSLENAIFFQAGDKVQGLSFNQIYQLDKK